MTAQIKTGLRAIKRGVALLLGLAIVACAPFPDPGGRLSAARDEGQEQAPVLQPIGPLLADADGLDLTAEVSADITSRLAALRARANRLRGPVVDRPTRQRMARGVR